MDLSVFDKINLAYCAVQRAKNNNNIQDRTRFYGEYDSALCWFNHRVGFLSTPTGFVNYKYM